MLARDWYYNERRQIGLDTAVASICDQHDDRDVRARAALTALGVQRGLSQPAGCVPVVPVNTLTQRAMSAASAASLR